MKYLLLMILVANVLFQPAMAASLRDKMVERIQEKRNAGLNQGFAVPQGVKVLQDVAYGEDARQRMDVYMPADQHANLPVIMMVHGGAWKYGDKAAGNVVLNKIRRWIPRGFVFISVNYRLLPAANPLEQAEDVIRALLFAQKSAAEWGGDAEKFILMGHSAGAHLVDLISAAPDKAQAMGAHAWLGTVSLDTATMNMVQLMESRHYRFYDEAMGKDEAFWKSVSPYQLLARGAPPYLLVCSSARPDKPCENTGNFIVHAAQIGVRAEMVEQALSHEEINRNLGKPGAYTDAVEKFMGTLDESIRLHLKRE